MNGKYVGHIDHPVSLCCGRACMKAVKKALAGMNAPAPGRVWASKAGLLKGEVCDLQVGFL